LIPRSAWRQARESYINLCISDFDTKSCEGCKIGFLGREGPSLADDEMSLKTDAVDFDSARFEGGDDVLGGGGFGA
jgi:hypothetical protein